MPKLILTCGISGSGKSTYAKDLAKTDWIEINRDSARFNLFCEGKEDWSLYKFTKDREEKVTKFCEDVWKLNSGQTSGGFYRRDVVVSNTNLNQKDHDYWKAKADEAGYEFEVVYFPITIDEAFKRDEKRGTLSVGRETIIQQWQKWLVISGYKKYVPDTSKPNAIIVDIDGTVATVNGRSHYDYTKVLTDSPRVAVMQMVEAWADRKDLYIIMMSGRESSCREDTLQWLRKWGFGFNELHMRPEGDPRNDRIIKEELFWEHVAPKYNVIAAIDDRPRVIRLWHDVGIPNVISVQSGYNEF